MLKIGVLGLGNIAKKAYLPVAAAMQDKYEWHLMSRNQAKISQISAQYGFTHIHLTLDSLLKVKPDAVFVHTPTETHYAIVRKLLLSGCNVYVDKPLSTKLEEVEELYRIANQRHLLLTCGFNRRFAPNLEKLKVVGDKQMIYAEKSCPHLLGNAKSVVWDLMIHPIDTALWLMDEPPITQHSRVITDTQGNLLQAYLSIEGQHQHVEVVTNMDAHANIERVIIQAQNTRVECQDLSLLSTTTTDTIQTEHRPNWEAVLETRGFVQIVQVFLKAVETDSKNPVASDSSILTHKICNGVVNSIIDTL